MNTAFVTDDGKTISKHFGRAQYYLVVGIEKNEETSRSLREKMGHQHFAGEDAGREHADGPHGFGPASQNRHSRMLEAITDCQIIVAGGMGRGAYVSMQESGKQVFVVSLSDIGEALEAFKAGTLKDMADLVH